MSDHLKSECCICGKPGKVCIDLVITGGRHVVHMGQCHDQLIKRESEERRVSEQIDGILRGAG